MLVDVGHKNFVTLREIIGAIRPESSKAKWLKGEAKEIGNLIDCTQGRTTNLLIVLNSGHIVLSSLKYGSLLRRIRKYIRKNREDINEFSFSNRMIENLKKLEG